MRIYLVHKAVRIELA